MTAPITRDDLDATIKYHRDGLWSHRWQMDTACVHQCEQTIKALEHYRALLDLIDARPFQEPRPEQVPALPPVEHGPI